MQKQWYPTALTLVIFGCSGVVENSTQGQGGTTVDAGIPAATGGMPSIRYGMLVTGGAAPQAGAATVGGQSSIDAGIPAQTGGTPTDMYGILPTGGRLGVGGGVVAYYGPLSSS